MHLTLSQGTLDEGSSPSFRAGRKLGDVVQALLWTLLHEEPQCPSRGLLKKVAERQLPIVVSLRHVNRGRAKWQLNGRKGRPRQALGHWPIASGTAIVQIMPRLSFVGVHLFAHWLDQHDACGPVVAPLTQAVEAHKPTHPGDDFALLHHREPTLRHRFAALFFAPLFGIDTLSGCDTREPPLPPLLGRSYQRSTLSQCLGQLERVDAAEALMPTLGPDKAEQIAYVDGHMIASWSRAAMHKGKITMLGRIMAGSQAVITHSAAGYALFVASHPPELHLSHVVVDYCQKVALSTGIGLFLIDRAVNSVAMAWAFDAQGLGVLCLLDDNEPQGLESFEATLVDPLDDGTKV